VFCERGVFSVTKAADPPGGIRWARLAIHADEFSDQEAAAELTRSADHLIGLR
jgi:hypothetical protein